MYWSMLNKEGINPIVIKLGSGIVLTTRGKLDRYRLSQIGRQVKTLRENGYRAVIVISGAVSSGRRAIKQFAAATERTYEQIMAGVGQAYLISEVYRIFEENGLRILQMLLTREDLQDIKKLAQVENLLKESLAHDLIPVLNENDVVSLHSFGGNDFLAAEAAKIVRASTLVILTNTSYLYSVNFDEKTLDAIDVVTEVNQKILDIASYMHSSTGVGGMRAKVEVGAAMQKLGITTIVANGKTQDILCRLILKRERIGTHFLPYDQT